MAHQPHIPRILIVDDQESVRKALRNLLDTQSHFALCGEARDGNEALQKAMELNPQVIVMDISMPGLDGLEATRRIVKALPNVEVLIFTQYDSAHAERAAREAGARGYLLKTEAAKRLVPALEQISRHEPFFPSRPN